MSLPEQTSEATTAKKESYRITNWSEYDRALVERGNITFWFDQEAVGEKWTPKPTGKRGGQWRYSDWAIQTLLMLKAVFHLPYRALEGFGRSLMDLLGLDMPIPDHSHMSRRAKTVEIQIPRREKKEPIHVVVDATGLKVFGEGEWKVRQHGEGKRRTWLKVHLAVDAHDKDVLGVEVTTVAWTDGEVFEDLIEQVEGTIEQIDGDGAFDTRAAYDVAKERGARLVVPPRENAVPWEEGHPRTQALAEIEAKGRKQWKKDSGYHHRSIAENAMYRLKQLFGSGVASRILDTQTAEVHARIAAMNKMTYLGMPVSVRVGEVAPEKMGEGEFPSSLCRHAIRAPTPLTAITPVMRCCL